MKFTIDQVLIDLLEPQERFEALRASALFRYGANLADLAYANPQDGPAPEAVSAIRNALDSNRLLDFQYTPYGGATIARRLIARRDESLIKARIPWSNVILTPGAMAALNILFSAIRQDAERNEVIILTPAWLDYPLYLRNLGIVPVLVRHDEVSERMDIRAVANAITPHTRAVVLSQPNNPTGLLYTRAELEELGRLLVSSDSTILLISDECHREFLFQESEFVSPAEIYPNTSVVYSFGKSLFMQGQRIGYILVSPNMEDAQGFANGMERLCRITGFCTPTALMQIAIRDLLDVKPDMTKIARRRQKMTECLHEAGYQFHESDATFFLYPRSPVADSEAFTRRLADSGLLVLPSSIFHDAGRFRLSLTAGDAQIEAACRILAEQSGR